MIEILTVGYEGFDSKGFFALLKRCRVETIVDVRELPLSRKKGFSKAALAEACQQNGVGYIHCPDLGCPREIRHAYRDDGDWKAYTKSFKAQLKSRLPILRETAKRACSERICLLCFEADFNFCHRSYVAEALIPLVSGPARISHITGPIQGRVVEFERAAVA